MTRLVGGVEYNLGRRSRFGICASYVVQQLNFVHIFYLSENLIVVGLVPMLLIYAFLELPPFPYKKKLPPFPKSVVLFSYDQDVWIINASSQGVKELNVLRACCFLLSF